MIETERLVLRPPEHGDLAFRQNALNTPKVMRYLGGPASPEKAAERLAGDIAGFAEYGVGFWIATHKQTGEPVGRCGVGIIRSGPAVLQGGWQIGWMLAEPFWGQGYAEEAARGVIDYWFGELGEKSIWSQTSASNAASTRMMARLGFERRADLDYVDPDYPAADNPTTVYSLGRGEWASRHGGVRD